MPRVNCMGVRVILFPGDVIIGDAALLVLAASKDGVGAFIAEDRPTGQGLEAPIGLCGQPPDSIPVPDD